MPRWKAFNATHLREATLAVADYPSVIQKKSPILNSSHEYCR